MNEVKRVAQVGETIKVINEYNSGWRKQPYPKGSQWIVRKVLNESKGLVACLDNEFSISSNDYLVLE